MSDKDWEREGGVGDGEGKGGGGGRGEMGPEDEPGLDEHLAGFWELGRPLRQAAPTAPGAPSVPLPILRRLGQPDFLESDLAALLGPAITRTAAAARRLAEGEWPEGG